MYQMDYIMSLMGLLLSVAFFTLMERKVMGLMHYRKGPNKVSMTGVLQPMSDAMKLLTKESLKMSMIKAVMYFIGPVFTMFTMMMCWSLYDYAIQEMANSMKMMSTVAIMSLSFFGMLFMSWGSNSKYSIMGGHRSVAQAISYEVCFVIMLISISYLAKSFSYFNLMAIQQGLWVSIFSLPFFVSWLMICMAESNRTPFDMSEGESEIVSGFNIEYGGGLFALIFISEYGMIIFLSFITSLFFLGGDNMLMKMFFISILFVWVRCSFPRVRYDKLMMMSWKVLLPYSLMMMNIMLMLI